MLKINLLKLSSTVAKKISNIIIILVLSNLFFEKGYELIINNQFQIEDKFFQNNIKQIFVNSQTFFISEYYDKFNESEVMKLLYKNKKNKKLNDTEHNEISLNIDELPENITILNLYPIYPRIYDYLSCSANEDYTSQKIKKEIALTTTERLNDKISMYKTFFQASEDLDV
jgi:hypothetical protein